jgi:hypothetical protein
MSKRYWLIRGNDGFKTIFETKVKFGQFTADQIHNLLKALTAKKGLTCEEIVGAYAKRGTKIANDHLIIRYDFTTYMCGSNPFFTASIVDESGKIIPKSKLL